MIGTVELDAVETVESTELSELQRDMLELYDSGLNVFPVKYGTKRAYLLKPLYWTRIHRDYIPELFSYRVNPAVMTGKTSLNLTMSDCDDAETAKQQAREFAKRGLKPWVISTNRGCRFVWLSADGEIRNIQKNESLGRLWAVYGRNQLCLIPPAVYEDTGVVCQWSDPTGIIYPLGTEAREGKLPPTCSIQQLDWLPLELYQQSRNVRPNNMLNGLSKRNQDTLLNGAPRGERNSRLFAAACDAQGNHIPESLIEGLAMRNLVASDFPESEARDVIRKAYTGARAPARSTKHHVLPWEQALAFADQYEWKSNKVLVIGKTKSYEVTVGKRSLKSIFLACVERSRMDHGRLGDSFRAAQSEVEMLSKLSHPTVVHGLKALVRTELLKLEAPPDDDKNTGTRYYSFGKQVRGIAHLNTISNVPRSTNGNLNVQSSFPPYLFTRQGLGKGAGEVYQAILKERLSMADLSKMVRYHINTIRGVLHRLEDFDLVTKELGPKQRGKRQSWLYTGFEITPGWLDDMAWLLGVDKTEEEKKAKHQIAMQKNIGRRLLRTIQKQGISKRGDLI